jgi:hypothetical protein
MKSLLSVFVFALLARADSLPVVTILTASANQRCGNIVSACAPLEFDIPQLNGNVSSVTFTLTDQEGVLFRYYAGISGIGNYTADVSFYSSLALPGTDVGTWNRVTPTTVLTDGGVGYDVYNTAYYTTPGTLGLGGGGPRDPSSYTVSGSFLDPTQFEGTGFVPFFVTPGPSTGFGGVVSAHGEGIYDAMSLTVTEFDPSGVATPEPRWISFTLTCLLLGAVLFRRLRPAAFLRAGK